jgi:hypothetical protein
MMDGRYSNKLKELVKVSGSTKASLGKYNHFYQMQCNGRYGDQTRVMNDMQKILVGNVNYFRKLDEEEKPWHKPEFWDDSYKRKYEGDFIFYKNLQRNYGNLRWQIIRYFNPDNLKFTRELLDRFIQVEWKQTRSANWNNLMGCRWWMYGNMDSKDALWDIILGGVKENKKDFERYKAEEMLKKFDVSEKEFLFWIIELSKWSGYDLGKVNVEAQRKIYCTIRKYLLPLCFQGKVVWPSTRGAQIDLMKTLKNRASYYICKEVLGMRDKALQQISDE